MLPTYKTGQTLIATKLFFTLESKDIIILLSPSDKRLIVKRIKEKKGNTFFVVGDSEKESTDSRQFGWVERKQILAKVIFKLA